MAKLGIVERRWYKTMHNASGDECETQYAVSVTTRRGSNRRLLRRWKNVKTKTTFGWKLIEGNLTDERINALELRLLGNGFTEEVL